PGRRAGQGELLRDAPWRRARRAGHTAPGHARGAEVAVRTREGEGGRAMSPDPAGVHRAATGTAAAGAPAAPEAVAGADTGPDHAKSRQLTLSVFRGDATSGAEVEYRVPVTPGMVVLDAIHWIQAHDAPDLAVRWNCKAAKCGSCSAEVNGKPALMCKSRLDHFTDDTPIVVRPMKT